MLKSKNEEKKKLVKFRKCTYAIASSWAECTAPSLNLGPTWPCLALANGMCAIVPGDPF